MSIRIPVPGHPGVLYLGEDHTNDHVVYAVHLEVDGKPLSIDIPPDVKGLTAIANYCIPKVDAFRDAAQPPQG